MSNNHSVTGHLVRQLNAIQLMDQLAIIHISTIRLPDMSGNRMPTVELSCFHSTRPS